MKTQSNSVERDGAHDPPKTRRLSLGGQVLVGLVLGIVVGLFFGEKVAFLGIAGDAFIMLLQVTVIPYIMVSLITALGQLTLEDAKVLALKAGGVLLVLWGVGLTVVLLTPLAFPDWPSASFFSTSQAKEPKPVDFLQLYIPANPFFAMANAVVPATVLFSVLIGLALTSVKNKNALIEPLSAIGDALMGVTGFIGLLAPYGVFALTAKAAGTIDFADLNRLQVYVVTYVVIALILSLWLLPGLVTTITPLRYGRLMKAFQGPLIAAFATGSVLIVLPMLAADSKQLIEEQKELGNQIDESQAQSSIDVLIPAAFNFPNLGVILALMFVLFAGWYIGTSVPLSQYPVLSVSGLASLFGGTVLAIPFLLNLLQLPQDLFQLFITVDVLGSRFGTLLAATHIVTIALIGAFALQGRARLRFVPIVRFSAVSVTVLAVALIGIRTLYTYVVVAPYTKDEALKGLHLLVKPQPAKVYVEAPLDKETGAETPASLSDIQRRGVLRVCYSPDDYPSAFLNNENPPQLVGFDIEMAHRFARSMNLPIEFWPASSDAKAEMQLNSGFCDIFMSGKAISASRAEHFLMTSPVFNASVGLIVRDYRRDEFRTIDDLRKLGSSFRLVIPESPDVVALAKTVLPNATLVPIRNTEEQKKILASGARGVDAIANFSEEGAAWTLLYPQFTLVVPKPTIFLPIGYAVALGNDRLLNEFNAWLLAEQARGDIDRLYKYWMLGEAAKTQKPPRWSVIRDVLHWVN
jgi:Na+/H+-dicarboxylate symporter/ABC-type amino acid transport substrate-binding protein